MPLVEKKDSPAVKEDSPAFYRDQATSLLEKSKGAQSAESRQSFESVARWYQVHAEHVERLHNRAWS